MYLGEMSLVNPGDLDEDGVDDLVASAAQFKVNGEGPNGKGALVILYMNADGTAREGHEVSQRTLGVTEGLTLRTGTISTLVGPKL